MDTWLYLALGIGTYLALGRAFRALPDDADFSQ